MPISRRSDAARRLRGAVAHLGAADPIMFRLCAVAARSDVDFEPIRFTDSMPTDPALRPTLGL
eukprot:9501334-Pyramimonas_sp.AAC.1